MQTPDVQPIPLREQHFTPSSVTGTVPPADQPGSGAREVDEHLLSLLDPTAFQAEQYRALRHMLERLHGAKTMIAFTSPVDGDGKTTTALNLAGALAQAPDARILVGDLDLRDPSVADLLGLRTRKLGFVDAILDPALTLADVVHRHPDFPLWILPAGRSLALPYELLKSPRLNELLHEARQQFTYVILDTPPLIPVPDSRLIGEFVDGVLMVVAANQTPRRLLEESLNLLDPSRLLGIVFNRDDQPMSGYHRYYYGYARSNQRRRRGR